jgi:hypothetical protein
LGILRGAGIFDGLGEVEGEYPQVGHCAMVPKAQDFCKPLEYPGR